MIEPAAYPKYQHVEAFCLMQYQDEVTGEIELLWNSRDGVTPFCIPARDAKRLMQHTNFAADRRALDYQPEPGMRVFIDYTRERFLGPARQWVEQFWDYPEYPLEKCLGYEGLSKAEAAQKYVADEFSPGQPCIIEVDGG